MQSAVRRDEEPVFFGLTSVGTVAEAPSERARKRTLAVKSLKTKTSHAGAHKTKISDYLFTKYA